MVRAFAHQLGKLKKLPDTTLLVLAGLAAPVVVHEHPSDDVRGGVHVPKCEPHRRVVLQRLLHFQYTARRVPVLACSLQQHGSLYRKSQLTGLCRI